MTRTGFREEVKFLLFAFPWLVGFIGFFILPAGTSLVYSFYDYNGIADPVWVGWGNFNELMNDPIYLKSLRNTLFFVFFGVPANLIFQVLVATLLNSKVKGISFFRTMYYLPYLVPAIATTFIWRLVFSTDFGIVNHALSWFGVDPIPFMDDPHLIKPVIVTMLMWASGSGILVILAALKAVPSHLHEAAKIDGAGPIRTYFVITLPLITPALLFSVVMQIIYMFQMFTEPFLLSKGGPDYASQTYMLNSYFTAFRDLKFGLAMSQAWILAVIMLIITIIVIGTSRRWVYYEGEQRG